MFGMMKNTWVVASGFPRFTIASSFFYFYLFTFYWLGLLGPAEAQQAAPSIQALTTAGTQTVYAGSFGMGVFRSENRGQSWTAANIGLSDPFILCLATTHDGTVYAGTFRGGVSGPGTMGRAGSPSIPG